MKISDDTLGFINLIEEYAKGELRKKNDLEICIEIAASYSGQDEINKLIFEGKVLWNLFSKLKTVSKEEKGVELIQKEFEDSLVRFKDYLSIFYDKLEETDKSRFDDIYFQMTRGCVLNLTDLAHDLAKVKDLMILQKSKNK